MRCLSGAPRSASVVCWAAVSVRRTTLRPRTHHRRRRPRGGRATSGQDHHSGPGPPTGTTPTGVGHHHLGIRLPRSWSHRGRTPIMTIPGREYSISWDHVGTTRPARSGTSNTRTLPPENPKARPGVEERLRPRPGGQGVAGSNPVVPTVVSAGRRPALVQSDRSALTVEPRSTVDVPASSSMTRSGES
jgi:hypothetical protein